MTCPEVNLTDPEVIVDGIGCGGDDVDPVVRCIRHVDRGSVRSHLKPAGSPEIGTLATTVFVAVAMTETTLLSRCDT